MEEIEILSGALIVVLLIVCVLLRILLHRSISREEAAIEIADYAVKKVINNRPRPTRTYQAMADDNLHKIAFFRRDTPTESVIHIGAYGWDLERCRQEGLVLYANTDGKGTIEERRDVEDYLTAIMMDALIGDFALKMNLQAAGLQDTAIVNDQIVEWEREGTPVDESLLFAAKKKTL